MGAPMTAQEKRNKLVYELTQTAFSVNPNQLRQKFHELLTKYVGPPVEDEELARRLRDLFSRGGEVSTEAIVAAVRSEQAAAEPSPG